MSKKLIDLTNQTFDRLTVLYELPRIHKYRRRFFCLCKCGNKIPVIYSNLTGHVTKSCGCIERERIASHTSLRKEYPSEYKCWQKMKERCYNPKAKGYHDYGGRGIKVCNRWQNSFQNFFEDLGKKPSPDYSIERQRNNGNYTPTNCRWATRIEQANNKRNNCIVKHKGVSMTLPQWARTMGISSDNLRGRLNLGMSADVAITKPFKKRPRTFIEFNNKKLTVTEWSRELKMSQAALCKRLRKWTVEKSLTTPPRHWN